MPRIGPLDHSYPWEQLTLLEPDLFRVKVLFSLVAATDRLVTTIELRADVEDTLIGLQTFGGDLSKDSVAEVLAEVARWVEGARTRLMPFI